VTSDNDCPKWTALSDVDATTDTTEESDALPPRLEPGQVISLTLGAEPVVAVGSAPYGFPAIFTPAGWQTLQRLKLTTLKLRKGHVYAGSAGRDRGQWRAARILTNTGYDCARVVLYRNGNPLDLRPVNLVVAPYSTHRKAKRKDAPPPGVTERSDGTRWPRGVVPSTERLRRLMGG
jgi:hypothetical protein